MGSDAQRVEDVAALVAAVEATPTLPVGTDERFLGYGVMAAPFRSGHLLAMRRFVATSVGPGYTSVWHRAPNGEWTFYSDAPPMQACPRYFGSALNAAVSTPIELRWPGPNRMEMAIPSVGFRWTIEVASTGATRVMTALGSVMPDSLWRSPIVLGAMARIAGPMLGAGRLQLAGVVPNGQRFVVNPMRIWSIRSSVAVLAGEDLGAPGALAEQVRLGDFALPAAGLFATGRAFFEPADEKRHRLVADSKASTHVAL
jgi:hypothetical protein